MSVLWPPSNLTFCPYSLLVTFVLIVEQIREPWLSPAVSCGSSNKAVKTGLHHTYSALDIRSIVQGLVTTLTVVRFRNKVI